MLVEMRPIDSVKPYPVTEAFTAPLPRARSHSEPPWSLNVGVRSMRPGRFGIVPRPPGSRSVPGWFREVDHHVADAHRSG
ncbi:unnamed protein product [Gemmataceae bacterium]|nr:unnamed protein product [Gemmataceae bacterium]VTU02590.1 unnamed protein product [Gemmataceae bacterium]